VAIFIVMATFKIKAEDKAAFINKLEKLGIGVDTSNMKSGTDSRGGKIIKWFTFDVPNPDDVKKVRSMLRQSPAINTLKEMVIKELKKYLEM
jgi:hypothetical protein